MSESSKSSILHAGSVLGRYELLLPIAKGGMAQVWAARLRGSRGFQKLVAIKTILPDVLDNTRMERMFLEEAQLASQIHHPNVVSTLELGEQDGTLYLVMDWVDGEPLNQVMNKATEQGGLPLPIAVNLIGQACQGLYAAHDLRDDNGALLGVVHRDVSPQNLLISFSGTAKLVDFGIAKATARSSGLTEAGELKGKFAFMAPEQVRGHALDCRTDLFALGILLYAITTGKHPFRGSHPGETVQNICSEKPPTPPSALVDDYPVGLEAVVLRALAKAPADRFANANEMLAALEEAMPGPLEASFEVEVASYLRNLFGARATERRTAIRVAQEQIDRQRQDTSASSGTLRAISLDRKESEISGLEPPPATSLTTPSSPAPLLPQKSRRPLWGAAAVVGVAAAFALFRVGSGPAPASSAAASSPVPPEVAHAAPSSAANAPLAPPRLEVAATSPTELPVEADADAASDKKRDRKAAHAVRVVAAGVKAAPASSAAPAVAAAAAAPVSTPVAPASPPAAAPAASANAWDRGAFGGRH
ncbi:MAG TPA: serine/threonine-protein kinase [Polyangiaceae bacterium]|nr:serine/threonine-protein kinase [Polyangiaceae bacterium]